MDAPEGKKNQTREDGKVTVIPHIGGLHHHYESKQHDPKDKGGSVFGTHRRAGQPSMDEIAWHRRETRRQTEKTNLVLELGSPPPTRQRQQLGPLETGLIMTHVADPNPLDQYTYR